PVLPGQAKVGDHSSHIVRGSPSGCIDQEQQLHKIVRWRIGGLNNEQIASSYGFIVRGLKLPITESVDGYLPWFPAHCAGNLTCQGGRGRARENFNRIKL